MNFYLQLFRVIFVNPLGWLWLFFGPYLLADAIFGFSNHGEPGDLQALLIFGGITLFGWVVAVAISRHAAKTGQLI